MSRSIICCGVIRLIQNVNSNTINNTFSSALNKQKTAALQSVNFDSYLKTEEKSSEPAVYKIPEENSGEAEGKKPEEKSKKTIWSQVEGNYYCTYMIDAKGNKILLSQVPVDVAQLNKTDNMAAMASGSTTNQGNEPNNVNSENTKEALELIKSVVGIPNEIDTKKELK